MLPISAKNIHLFFLKKKVLFRARADDGHRASVVRDFENLFGYFIFKYKGQFV